VRFRGRVCLCTEGKPGERQTKGGEECQYSSLLSKSPREAKGKSGGEGGRGLVTEEVALRARKQLRRRKKSWLEESESNEESRQSAKTSARVPSLKVRHCQKRKRNLKKKGGLLPHH